MELPGFELLEKLGEGGMATVWKGRQISLNRPVAIKILSERLARQQADTERFLSEAQAMANLKHSGIIQVYDANIYNDTYYFVMEYVAGYSIGDWIRRKKKIPEADALITVENVAIALNYAWESHKMIHCDIKPDNIMIDADGTIKVADMGLARTIGTASLEMGSDEVMGTPNYMSPEQVVGEPDLDCRSDIYSLGAMLYEMVTGLLPFGGCDATTVMESHAAGFLADPYDVNHMVSMSTCWLIEKMMMKDRNARYVNWSAVLTDITRVKRGMMLRDGEFPEGLSTIRRSTRRTKPIAHYHKIDTVEKKKGFPVRAAIAVAAGLVAAIGITVFILSVDSGKRFPTPPGPPLPPRSSNAVQPLPQAAGKQLFDDAEKWAAEHPAEFTQAIQRYVQVENEAVGSPWARQASQRIDELQAARTKAAAETLADLKKQADKLVADRRFEEAALLYEKFAGPLAGDTTVERYKQRDIIRGLAEALRKQQEAELCARRFSELTQEIGKKCSDGNLRSAEQELDKAIADPAMQGKSEDLASLKAGFNLIRKADERVLESFRGDAGKTVSVFVPAGTRTLKINTVAGFKILCEEKTERDGVVTMAPVEVALSDLSSREVLKRLGPADDDVACMKKGVLALQAGCGDVARGCFERAPASPLRDLLLASASSQELQGLEQQAEPELMFLVRAAGIKADRYDEQKLVASIGIANLTTTEANALKQKVEQYRNRFGKTSFAKNAEPVVSALATRAQTYGN